MLKRHIRMQTKKGQVIRMDKKQTYVAPSADVLGIFNFAMGSNDLPSDEFDQNDGFNA